MFGGADEDRFILSFNDAVNVAGTESVDGGASGSDFDTVTVDISGFGWGRFDITYDPLSTESGTLTFFAANGTTVIGTWPGVAIFAACASCVPYPYGASAGLIEL